MQPHQTSLLWSLLCAAEPNVVLLLIRSEDGPAGYHRIESIPRKTTAPNHLARFGRLSLAAGIQRPVRRNPLEDVTRHVIHIKLAFVRRIAAYRPDSILIAYVRAVRVEVIAPRVKPFVGSSRSILPFLFRRKTLPNEFS